MAGHAQHRQASNGEAVKHKIARWVKGEGQNLCLFMQPDLCCTVLCYGAVNQVIVSLAVHIHEHSGCCSP
jgi:hypothetical protein